MRGARVCVYVCGCVGRCVCVCVHGMRAQALRPSLIAACKQTMAGGDVPGCALQWLEPSQAIPLSSVQFTLIFLGLNSRVFPFDRIKIGGQRSSLAARQECGLLLSILGGGLEDVRSVSARVLISLATSCDFARRPLQTRLTVCLRLSKVLRPRE